MTRMIHSDSSNTDQVSPSSSPTYKSGTETVRKIKSRKPYTITKQREVWSDYEHAKFLQAIHMYGRDWRKIEAQITTKTVIQIRSHAQKYFLKVLKNNPGDTIPPARPKRRNATQNGCGSPVSKGSPQTLAPLTPPANYSSVTLTGEVPFAGSVFSEMSPSTQAPFSPVPASVSYNQSIKVFEKENLSPPESSFFSMPRQLKPVPAFPDPPHTFSASFHQPLAAFSTSKKDLPNESLPSLAQLASQLFVELQQPEEKPFRPALSTSLVSKSFGSESSKMSVGNLLA